MNRPLISVITVVRNSRDVIFTVQSVLKWVRLSKEHLIIDGASTDGTLNALKPYRKHIRLISEPDRGIYDAMNKGLRLAKGRIVGFLNAGDTFAGPHSLRAIADAFAQDKALGAVWGGLEIRGKDGSLKRYWPPEPYTPGAFAKGWMPSHPTFYALRKELLALGGFNTEYRLAADYDLMLRALETRGLKGKALDQTLVQMQSGGASQASLSALFRHNREAWVAAQKAGITSASFAAFLAKKWFRKIPQLFRR